MTATIERKTFPLTEFKISESGEAGSFEGYAAVFHNVDRGNDVIVPGAFKDAIPQFLKEGFISDHHAWNDAIGMPIEAREDEKGLFVRADFHSTALAQERRTLMAERKDRGLMVGLSIGYLPDYDEGVEYREDGVRVLKRIAHLPEVAFAILPMNRQAGATDVKTTLGAGLPYLDHGEQVLAAVSDYAARTRDRAEFRAKEGRVLSSANRKRLATIREGLMSASTDLETILDETDPDREKGQLDIIELERIRAQLNGVPV